MEQTPKIDLSVKGLNLPLAQLCAVAAKDAYTEIPTILDTATDTRIVMTEHDDFILVAIKGSSSIRNFITDAEFIREEVAWDGLILEIHRGFLECADSVRVRLLRQLSAVQGEQKSPKRIVVSGHSLGGAVAIALAKDIVKWCRDFDWGTPLFYTFGQPRVGNAAFAKFADDLFGANHFRFEDESDLVTRLPGWLIGYRHSGQSVFLAATGGYLMNPVLIWRLFSDVWEFWKLRNKGPVALALALTLLLKDHGEDRYIERINALV